MVALETMDLENNDLGHGPLMESSMGRELVGLSRMQCLNLAQNGLANLPDIISDFCSLRILDLTNNKCAFLSIRFL